MQGHWQWIQLLASQDQQQVLQMRTELQSWQMIPRPQQFRVQVFTVAVYYPDGLRRGSSGSVGGIL